METPAKEKRAGVRSVYTVDHLNDKAKRKAHEWYTENAGDPLLQSHMINLLKAELDERGIMYATDSIDVRYSLSHSQGDGFMFEGIFDWKGLRVRVKHSGHYYHSYSKEMTWYNPETDTEIYAHDEEESFEKMYQEVCKLMEQKGYDEIEYELSEEVFMEAAAANEWTFTDTGERLDADSTV